MAARRVFLSFAWRAPREAVSFACVVFLAAAGFLVAFLFAGCCVGDVGATVAFVVVLLVLKGILLHCRKPGVRPGSGEAGLAC